MLCDRYIDSTRAYQGGAGGLADAEIMALHQLGAGLMPDRTLYLKLPLHLGAERALARDQGRLDRFGSRGSEYHVRLGVAFDNMTMAEPDRITGVDASGSAEKVTGRLLAALADLL